MLLRIIFGIGCSVFFFSCKNKQEPAPSPLVKAISQKVIQVSAEKILGNYTGQFNNSAISLTFRHMAGNNISGFNVLKGLKRNLTGSIEIDGGKLHLLVTEPGTNSTDGSFELWIDTNTWKGSGKWTPLEKGKEVHFSFERRGDESSFPAYFTIFEDSLGNILEFDPKGTCTYKYFSDSTKKQLLSIRGNFEMRADSTLATYWQKNEIFPSGKCLFKARMEPLFPENDYWELNLKGEGRSFMRKELP